MRVRAPHEATADHGNVFAATNALDAGAASFAASPPAFFAGRTSRLLRERFADDAASPLLRVFPDAPRDRLRGLTAREERDDRASGARRSSAPPSSSVSYSRASTSAETPPQQTTPRRPPAKPLTERERYLHRKGWTSGWTLWRRVRPRNGGSTRPAPSRVVAGLDTSRRGRARTGAVRVFSPRARDGTEGPRRSSPERAHRALPETVSSRAASAARRHATASRTYPRARARARPARVPISPTRRRAFRRREQDRLFDVALFSARRAVARRLIVDRLTTLTSFPFTTATAAVWITMTQEGSARAAQAQRRVKSHVFRGGAFQVIDGNLRRVLFLCVGVFGKPLKEEAAPADPRSWTASRPTAPRCCPTPSSRKARQSGQVGGRH